LGFFFAVKLGLISRDHPGRRLASLAAFCLRSKSKLQRPTKFWRQLIHSRARARNRFTRSTPTGNVRFAKHPGHGETPALNTSVTNDPK
jgi:hypothetical protein